MRALLLSVALLCGTSFGADEVPANVAAFKERCEAAKVALVEKYEKEYEADKAQMKSVKSAADKAKRLAELKKSLEALKERKAKPWHSFQPVIDNATVGSIGALGDVTFRPSKITGDKAVGVLVRPGAAPRLLVRAGGNVARNVYSEPGPQSESPAIVIGASDLTAGKSSRLAGVYEVVTTKPLTLKPFDVEPFQSLK